jgi:hypothetical protein
VQQPSDLEPGEQTIPVGIAGARLEISQCQLARPHDALSHIGRPGELEMPHRNEFHGGVDGFAQAFGRFPIGITQIVQPPLRVFLGGIGRVIPTGEIHVEPQALLPRRRAIDEDCWRFEHLSSALSVFDCKPAERLFVARSKRSNIKCQYRLSPQNHLQMRDQLCR